MARWETDSQLISLSVVSSALRNLVRWQDLIHPEAVVVSEK